MWTYLVLVAVIIILIHFFATNKRYRWFYVLAKTYKRDIRGLRAFSRLLISIAIYKYRNKTVASLFSDLVKKNPQKIAFYFEDEIWTFTKVEDFANKVARYFQSQELQKGDCVALMLENRPEYVCIWLGLSKLGIITALINTNLVSNPLVHSVKAANCKAIIFGSSYANSIKNVLNQLKLKKHYQFHENSKHMGEVLSDCIDLRENLKDVSDDQLETVPEVEVTDPLIYIYTSGTTGLPKAAIVSNIRYIYVSSAAFYATFCKSSDTIYVPLPLYHSAAGMLALGLTLQYGTTMVIRKKFSASNYWKDCEKYKCTRAQYIGEMCRYILASSKDEPVKHQVKSIMGNGLKPQIWTEFVEKFKIKHVYEYYGATEGISNTVNMDNTVGCVGFVPRYAKWLYPITLIKCVEDTGEPIRDKKGRCIECNIDETGLIIGKINQRRPIFMFKGYSDKKETDKKILRNVFSEGDMYFNSGDIFRTDEFGNLFFKDRIGDTFRWKGENVSTSEVEAVISNEVQLSDAVVYGIEIPGTEGRAGMAAIVDSNKTLDMDLLSNALKQHLPKYAVPLFVRIMESVPLTGTFKLKKVQLRAEAYDINKVKDALYFYKPNLEKYVPLTPELYKDIMNGKMKL